MMTVKSKEKLEEYIQTVLKHAHREYVLAVNDYSRSAEIDSTGELRQKVIKARDYWEDMMVLNGRRPNDPREEIFELIREERVDELRFKRLSTAAGNERLREVIALIEKMG